ncbi:MAG TPA: hypothetical protein VJQ56_14120 [Blastocatellia bacterium]|nr:hypothetical protein [Blastocatellia bacterium]
MFNQQDSEASGRSLTWRRIRTVIIGAVLVVVAGALVVSLYTYTQYGGTPFDKLLGRGGEKQSPDVGKLAYDKYQQNVYYGVIKGEGRASGPGRVPVYYIEKAGGNLVEVAKERVEVRAPASDKQ